MALFGRRRRSGVPSSTAGTPDPLDLLAGTYFVKCLRAGEIPPPAYAFLNRFLHGDPAEWSDEFAPQRASMADGDALRASVGELGEALDRVEREGAPLPILQALEEAVTLNLTGLVLLVAGDVINSRPDLGEHTSLSGDPFVGWTADGTTDRLAVLIREEASSVDAAIATSAPEWARRPGECFRCCVDVIQGIAGRLAAHGQEELDRLDIVDPENAMQRQLRRMFLANDAIKQRQDSSQGS